MGRTADAALIEDLVAEASVATAVFSLARAFATAGLDTPEIDARRLVQGILALAPEALIASPGHQLGSTAVALQAAARRRLAHEPVSRILGSRAFYGRSFEITPDVLDPRADTECVVEAALEIIDRKGRRYRPVTIADVGTGSGAILVTLLAELPQAKGIAIDVSTPALVVAGRNGQRHGVGARMTMIQTSSLRGLGVVPDLVVSNPPYIPTGDLEGLEPDVRLYDPRLALDGGQDGLAIYREIIRDIREMNAPVDVVFEVGTGQGESVAGLLLALSGGRRAQRVEQKKDLGGHVRCVTFETEN